MQDRFLTCPLILSPPPHTCVCLPEASYRIARCTIASPPSCQHVRISALLPRSSQEASYMTARCIRFTAFLPTSVRPPRLMQEASYMTGQVLHPNGGFVVNG